jgi:GNAT superfamily N-acetyltransferase
MTLEFKWLEVAPGCWALTAFHQHMAGPVGTVWIRFVGARTLDVLDIYVTTSYRRKGVGTALHKEMLRTYPDMERFMTGVASGKKSARLMRKAGYRNTRIGWILDLKKDKKRKRKGKP